MAQLADPRAVDRRTVGVPTGDQPQRPGAPNPQLASLLAAQFERLSNQIAGGQRVHPDALLPVDPNEGLFLDEYLPHLPPNAELEALSQLITDPTVAEEGLGQGFDPSQLGGYVSEGRDGNGYDWYRSGQAPNNYSNRNHPLYQARAEFVSNVVAPTIQRLFPGMNVTGQNYYRPPGGGGGQAQNSDHQSAGALDIFSQYKVGTAEQKEELRALRDWAAQQPWVSFVRCLSPHHWDHVHLSVDINWVRDNAYNGPTGGINTTAATTPTSSPSGTAQQPTVTPSPTVDPGIQPT